MPSDLEAYGDWSVPLRDVANQREWDRLPPAIRAAYRMPTGRDTFTIDLGAGPVTLDTALGRLDPQLQRIPLPADGPIDWSFLDRLPRCTEITWSGPDRGLTAALESRPSITSLAWSGAPPTLDLEATRIHHLYATGPSLRTIRLPPRAHTLQLGEVATACTVSATGEGRWLHLTLTHPARKAPHGLSQVRRVTLLGAGVLSAAALTESTAIHSLRLHWSAPPGRLDAPESLLALPGLRLIEMFDAYGIHADTIPDLPLLSHLDVYGLRGSVARALRSRFRRTGVELTVRGAKSDTWLAANLDNPFRDWADDSPRAGAAACKAYATALRAVGGLPPNHEFTLAEPLLHDLVTKLNALDEKYEIIDTIRREQAGDAFTLLATRAGVPTEIADHWFDTWRDF